MTRAEYRRQCLFRNREFVAALAGYFESTGADRAERAREITRCFQVDPSDLLGGWKSEKNLRQRFDRPRGLVAPGHFIGYPAATRLQEAMLKRDRRNHMFEFAKLWIPVYDSTTGEDINWPEIHIWQRRLYGKTPHTRKGRFEARLAAWDYLAAGLPGGSDGLRRKLGLQSTRKALRVLEQAWADVRGSKYPGLEEALKAVGQSADLNTHWSGCANCKQGIPCSVANRLLDRETGAVWKDLGIAPGISPEAALERKAARGRKKPHQED